MRKFIVFGRGRSGTTVLADELGHHPDLHCVLHSVRYEGFETAVIEPFARHDRPETADAADQMRRASAPPPYDWWTLREGLPVPAQKYARYLDELEAWSSAQGNFSAIGFKIIDNQMTERAGLLEELLRRDYRVVHIRRRNVVRHALSGLIAQQRGVYNERNYELPDQKYHIDCSQLLTGIHHILVHARHWDERLKESKAAVVYTVYEDFLANRESFYAPILDFLGVDRRTLPASDFTKMTPNDLSEVIANYDEIRRATEHFGMQECLAET